MRSEISIAKPLKFYLLIVFCLDVCAWAIETFCHHLRYFPWPYVSSFLNETPPPDVGFAIPIFTHVHTPQFFDPTPVPFMYPAALAPIFGAILSFANPIHVVRVITCAVIASAASAFAFALYRRGLPLLQCAVLVLGTLLTSYPLAFEWKQGNVEIIVWAMLCVAIWCFLNHWDHPAAALIGLMGAMKLFPFVYLGLFLARRRFAPMVTAGVVALIATLVGLRYISPSISGSWHGISANLAYYKTGTALLIRKESGYDHSLFSIVKYLGGLRVGTDKPIKEQHLFSGFMLSVALAGTVLFFSQIRKLPFVNQIICFSIVSVLLPPVSFDYTLLNLYVAFALLTFVALAAGPIKVSGLLPAFICLAIATGSESEFIRHAHSFGGQIKAVDLCVLFYIALKYPFQFRDKRMSKSPATHV